MAEFGGVKLHAYTISPHWLTMSTQPKKRSRGEEESDGDSGSYERESEDAEFAEEVQTYEFDTPAGVEKLTDILRTFPLYSNGKVVNESTLDEIKKYEAGLKPSRTPKGGAFTALAGICGAIEYITGCERIRAEGIVYRIVCAYAPTLTEAEDEAIDEVTRKWQAEGYLSRMYYDPIVEADLRNVLQFAEKHGLKEAAEVLSQCIKRINE